VHSAASVPWILAGTLLLTVGYKKDVCMQKKVCRQLPKY